MYAYYVIIFCSSEICKQKWWKKIWRRMECYVLEVASKKRARGASL